MKSLIQELKSGMGVPHLFQDDIKRFPLLLPSMTEQRQIAEYLDRETGQIDALITKQEQLVETLTERRQAVIAQAVTRGLDPDIKLIVSPILGLGLVPSHWKWRRLKDLTLQISKGTTPSTIGADYVDEGTRFLRGEDLVNGSIVSTKPLFISQETDIQLRRSQLKAADVLFVIAGTLGKTAVVTPDILPANLNQAIAFIRLMDKSAATFVQYWLTSDFVSNMTALTSVTAAQPNLSMENLGNFAVPVPPTPERDAIVSQLDTIVGDLDSLVAKATQLAEVLRERRQALISAAVTGKIDVRGL